MEQLVDRVTVHQNLHKPAELVGMEPDTVTTIIASYVLWTVINSWYWVWIVAVIPWLYATVKADKPRGFMQHLLVRYGVHKLHKYPPPEVEFFCE